MRDHMLFLFVILLIAMLGVVFVLTYIAGDRSFDTCANIAKRDAPKNWATKVKIGIIGDSWVADQKLDQAVLGTMLVSGIQAEVVSSGQPGAVSRQIYRNLTSEDISPFSSRYLLMDEDIDYLVVVAGINDTVEHIGRDYYAHHMLCIIKAAQTRGMHPIIVEIPEYGIEITPSKSFLNYAKRLIYRIAYDGNDHRVITAYREALRAGLTPEMMKDMSIVALSTLNKNYPESTELYENPNHLSKEGYQKLGQMISETIIKSHKNRLQRMANRRS